MDKNYEKSSLDLRKYQASKNYIHRTIGGENILISIGSDIANFNGYVQLNKTALILWNCLQKPCKAEQLVNTLKDEFDILDEQAEIDVQNFIHKLLKHQMINILDEE
ncbi:MAG: PqqD family protein [Thomasclavelia sp.]